MYHSVWIETPIGLFEINGSELGIRKVQLSSTGKPRNTAVPDLPFDHPVLECGRQLVDYFAGTRKSFDLRIDWGDAPAFHRHVWEELLRIPYGKTASYSDIAERVGNPTAVRAVGLANRSNPIAIIVPCHRVIGKSGALTGYFYGLDTKILLLRHENPLRFAEQGELF